MAVKCVTVPVIHKLHGTWDLSGVSYNDACRWLQGVIKEYILLHFKGILLADMVFGNKSSLRLKRENRENITGVSLYSNVYKDPFIRAKYLSISYTCFLCKLLRFPV